MKKPLALVVLFVAAARFAFAAAIQFNFGGTAPVDGWNLVPGVVGASSTATLTELVDSDGRPTKVGLKMKSRFGGVNKNGPSTGGTVNRFGVPDAVVSTCFYGNTAPFSGRVAANPSFTLTGLDPKATYTFVIYAGRVKSNDKRTGTYQVAGANRVVGEVDAANNTDKPLRLKDIRPTESGEVTFSVTAASSNTNEHGFFYLNALVVERAK